METDVRCFLSVLHVTNILKIQFVQKIGQMMSHETKLVGLQYN